MIAKIADTINFELNKCKFFTFSASMVAFCTDRSRGDIDIIKIIARQ